MTGKSRNIGLDIVRAFAIILVLIGHFELVSDTPYNYTFYKMGVYGVELFFVLSGFLIGGILIRTSEKQISGRSILNFWKRRWLRTLPLFLLIYLIRELFFNPEGTFHYLHPFFLHTFLIPDGYPYLWFGETWSLVVEEWFYLLLPFLFLIWSKLHLKINGKVFMILGILVMFVIVRYLYITRISPSPDYNTQTRIFAPLRLDSILFGVLLAMLKTHFTNLYLKLSKLPPFLLVLLSFALLNLIPNILIYDYQGEKTVPVTIGFSLVSLHLVLLLPFFESSELINRISRSSWLTQFILKTSLFSYCIYLVHEPVYDLLVKGSADFSWVWFGRMSLAWVIIYLLGWMSYRFFEKPILNWRDKNVEE